MVRWTLPGEEGDFTAWMPDRGITPKNSLEKKITEGDRCHRRDPEQGGTKSKCRSSRNFNVSAVKSQEWHRATSSGLCTSHGSINDLLSAI